MSVSKTVTIRNADYLGDGVFVKTLNGSEDYSGRVALSGVTMYYNFFNIDTKYDNTQFTIGPTDNLRTIDIQPGSYSVYSLNAYIKFEYEKKTGHTIDEWVIRVAESFNRVALRVPAGWRVSFNKGMAEFLGAKPTSGTNIYHYDGLALNAQQFLLENVPQIEQVVEIRFKTNIIADPSDGELLYSFVPTQGFPSLLNEKPIIPDYYKVTNGVNLSQIVLTVIDQKGRPLDIEDFFKLRLHFLAKNE